MGVLAEAATEAGARVRIPMLAYHDTIHPGAAIAPPPGTDLLFAPRERCYGHAIDDPACARNRVFRADLAAWMRAYRGRGDAHAFEYYYDQILFRGLFPFLPEVVFRDQHAYRAAGVTTFFALQVAGPAVAPEHNMLAAAWGEWEARPSATRFAAWFARGLDRRRPGPWRAWLAARARIFRPAMRSCGHQPGIYLDYRWLPESDSAFARRMVGTYARAARSLEAAAGSLRRATAGAAPALRALAARELRRARLETADLTAMAHQQEGVRQLARLHNRRRGDCLAAARSAFAAASAALERGEAAALAAGFGEDSWYVKNIARWLRREFAGKLQHCGG
jgi:hypothetical protein